MFHLSTLEKKKYFNTNKLLEYGRKYKLTKNMAKKMGVVKANELGLQAN